MGRQKRKEEMIQGRKKEVQNKYKIGEDEYKNSENLVRKKTKSKKKMQVLKL